MRPTLIAVTTVAAITGLVLGGAYNGVESRSDAPPNIAEELPGAWSIWIGSDGEVIEAPKR